MSAKRAATKASVALTFWKVAVITGTYSADKEGAADSDRGGHSVDVE